MRNYFLIALCAVLLLALMTPVEAITNGQPDNGAHPYVGLAVFDAPDPDTGVVRPMWRCSGSLLSPTLFLTAGHCTDGAVAARVWLDEDVESNPEYPYSGSTSYDGVPWTHPLFKIGYGPGAPRFITHDVGVIVLTEPVPVEVVGEYAQLPTQGLVDTLKMKTEVWQVGYGAQYQTRGGGPPVWSGRRVRLIAPALLIASNDVFSEEFMKLTANPAQCKGGTCFGDSGGPNLLAGTDTVLAVTSWGTNGNCAGVSYAFRVDTADSLDFIHQYYG
jgi:hypothetical protein